MRREVGLQRRPERRQGAYEADGYTVDGGGRAGADRQELQVLCGWTPGGLEQPEEMQGWTRGRCARPVDSSKERQASASASAAKKQGCRRRRLFSSPLSVKL